MAAVGLCEETLCEGGRPVYGSWASVSIVGLCEGDRGVQYELP